MEKKTKGRKAERDTEREPFAKNVSKNVIFLRAPWLGHMPNQNDQS